MSQALNPGSREAQKAGCLCPVIDNHYGRGYMGNPEVFCMRGDCPIHGEEAVFSGVTLVFPTSLAEKHGESFPFENTTTLGIRGQ